MNAASDEKSFSNGNGPTQFYGGDPRGMLDGLAHATATHWWLLT